MTPGAFYFAFFIFSGPDEARDVHPLGRAGPSRLAWHRARARGASRPPRARVDAATAGGAAGSLGGGATVPMGWKPRDGRCARPDGWLQSLLPLAGRSAWAMIFHAIQRQTQEWMALDHRILAFGEGDALPALSIGMEVLSDPEFLGAHRSSVKSQSYRSSLAERVTQSKRC